ncbi:hypothetical protein BU16DRAFT_522032 [Lophium mytilinum]|uniref:Uncharacterized protein n=1 Tax=Lophium mytilinum TaxID=390894 RepID=A0A6A6R831_9PEZI|nr:hypothetical protein BU16DRAFT_522032 [Lophium mytilinum]
MAEDSPDEKQKTSIYATVPVERDAVYKAFEAAGRFGGGYAEDTTFPFDYSVVKGVKSFIGKSIAATIRHLRGRYTYAPDLFIVIDKLQWPVVPPLEPGPPRPRKRNNPSSAYSKHNQDLLLVWNNFAGFPDALRLDLDRTIGCCILAELHGGPHTDWGDWLRDAGSAKEKNSSPLLATNTHHSSSPMATHDSENGSEDDDFFYLIYATVEIDRDAVQKVFHDADRQVEQIEEGEDWESIFRVLENVNFVGSSVAETICHWQVHKDKSPGNFLFIVIDTPQWPSAPPLEAALETGSPPPETEKQASTPYPDLLVVYNDFDGFPDAMRHSLEGAIGEVLRLETIGRPDWSTSLIGMSEPDPDLRGWSDKPEAKFACYSLVGDSSREDFTSALDKMNSGIRGRRDVYMARICVDAANTGGSDEHIKDIVEVHSEKARDLDAHPDWFAVVEQTSLSTNTVTLVYKGFGEAGYDHCPVPVEWAGEVLRWLGIGFCRWREWNELMELEAPVED